jgi:hypothetical protein
MSYNIIEANSFVAERSNLFYSDPAVASLADADTRRNQAFVNRVANNFFDWMPTKHDDFFEATTAALRGNGNGYRPQMVEAWSMLYGVGHEGNVDASRVDSNFQLQFSGLRSVTGYTGQLNPQFADDRSIEGPDGAAATGGGDYTPGATSPLLARVTRGQADVDFLGNSRTIPADAGAIERSGAAFDIAALLVATRMEAASLIVSAGGVVLQGEAARAAARMATSAIIVASPNAVLAGAAMRVAVTSPAVSIGVSGGGDYIPSPARTRGNGESTGFQVKAAGSELDYPINWLLEATESIVNSLWLVQPVEDGGLLVNAGTEKIVGNVTACLVSGGVYRRVYELTNIITTSDNRKYSQTMAFRIGPVERP